MKIDGLVGMLMIIYGDNIGILSIADIGNYLILLWYLFVV